MSKKLLAVAIAAVGGLLAYRKVVADREGHPMSKKLLAVAVAAVGALVAWKKVAADRGAEADLWAEATDKVD